MVMIGYIRTETLKRSLANLANCYDVEKHDLYLYLDAPFRREDAEGSQKMYELACSFCKRGLPHLRVIRREKNLGVPLNHIEAMNEVLGRYGRAIFFEDDVLVSRTFLNVLNRALDFYRDDKRIFCVNGFKHPKVSVPHSYAYDVYLAPRNSAWGFATWKDRWERVDFSLKKWSSIKSDGVLCRKIAVAGVDLFPMAEGVYGGRLKTWDVQCAIHMACNDLFAVEPTYSLSKNIGFSIGALHTGFDNPLYSHMKYYDFDPLLRRDIQSDKRIIDEFMHVMFGKNIVVRGFRKLERVLLSFTGSNNDPVDQG